MDRRSCEVAKQVSLAMTNILASAYFVHSSDGPRRETLHHIRIPLLPLNDGSHPCLGKIGILPHQSQVQTIPQTTYESTKHPILQICHGEKVHLILLARVVDLSGHLASTGIKILT